MKSDISIFLSGDIVCSSELNFYQDYILMKWIYANFVKHCINILHSGSLSFYLTNFIFCFLSNKNNYLFWDTADQRSTWRTIGNNKGREQKLAEPMLHQIRQYDPAVLHSGNFWPKKETRSLVAWNNNRGCVCLLRFEQYNYCLRRKHQHIKIARLMNFLLANTAPYVIKSFGGNHSVLLYSPPLE